MLASYSGRISIDSRPDWSGKRRSIRTTSGGSEANGEPSPSAPWPPPRTRFGRRGERLAACSGIRKPSSSNQQSGAPYVSRCGAKARSLLTAPVGIPIIRYRGGWPGPLAGRNPTSQGSPSRTEPQRPTARLRRRARGAGGPRCWSAGRFAGAGDHCPHMTLPGPGRRPGRLLRRLPSRPGAAGDPCSRPWAADSFLL